MNDDHVWANREETEIQFLKETLPRLPVGRLKPVTSIQGLYVDGLGNFWFREEA